MILHVDFETYSACELKDAGLDNYAKHPSTGVHCMAFAFDDGPVELWVPTERMTASELAIAKHIHGGGIVYAHNAAFELAIWNNTKAMARFPKLKAAQVRCTMAMAYAMGLPGKLEHAAQALGIPQQKDMKGARVMMQLAKPKSEHIFWSYDDAPEKFKALYAYCRQDVEVERALHHRLLELSPQEQHLWTLDYLINQRGVLADLRHIDLAVSVVGASKRDLDARMLSVTGGVVGSCSEVQLLVKWIRSQGVAMPGVAKRAVLDALDGELPPQVRKALELRKEAAKTSTAKLVAMQERASPDGRIRNLHQYHGAATGRWAGRGIQVHNLPRPRPTTKPKDIEEMFKLLGQPELLDMLYGPTMDAMADMVRGMIVPAPGKDFIACDFSAIEARVLAWLAGEQKVLDTFAAKEDIYKAAAGGIYGKPSDQITKDERQIGKVAVLALGYGGGKGAFQAMANGYGVKVSDDQAESIKQAWREAHPNIVRFWYDLENGANYAVETGEWVRVGPIQFRKKGSFLWCRLPSGRMLCYPYPELRTVITPWGAEKLTLTYMAVVADPKTKVLEDPHAFGSWKRVSTYGGSLAENVTQAVARDLLAHSLITLEDLGFPVVMHVHDEIVVEIESSCESGTLSKIEALMSQAPAWAQGLPLAAEGWRGNRYRK